MPLSSKLYDTDTDNFSQITIGLASPDSILNRSHGEVIKPETINYRSYKPEKDGLFSERIFGPTKDWECFCGKYRGMRYKGIICDRCGVEITRKDVRRKRMGHIELAVPIAHIWFFKSPPSKIGNILGLNIRQLEKVIYYESYLVINPGKAGCKAGELLTDAEYNKIVDNLGSENDMLPDDDPKKFIALMGGGAIRIALSKIDIRELSHDYRARILVESSNQRKFEYIKRLRIIEAFLKDNSAENNRPEWMVMKVIPVVPPDLRPLLPLDGGRFATSDLNDLYRRVIIRNNRLKRLIEVNAPEVILRNEKRMLQEAVDSLFDNGRKSVAMRSDGNRPLKSLSDNLRGKQGRFRYNLLGKRVDYSGRSVIVVGPDLYLHQCGLPKDMAIELFKPFIIRKLIERDYAKTVKSAKRMVERKLDFVWELLDELIKDHPIMLNRAPTLHRLGIQAFQPILIEGKAIQLHPLSCAAFNADFDGDQMAIHIPLSYEAQIEARLLMLAPRNILHPANGRPIAVPSQDMVLGCYYLTKLMPGCKGEGKVFSGSKEVIIALNSNAIDMHTSIKVIIQGQLISTTVGRVIFNDILPKKVRKIHFFNELLTKKRLEQIVAEVYQILGFDGTATFLDNLKELGFKYATRGGLSISLKEVEVPLEKNILVEQAQHKVEDIQNQYEMGLITDGERYNMIIDTWTHTTVEVTETMFKHLRNSQGGFNPLFMMADSGARGSKEQIRQLAGMRGLMAKPQKTMTGQKGEIIESPITANFKEGLSVLEYFISTHGARKGLADTALKTADAGYLTRRLVDVAQDIIISEDDCGTIRGIMVEAAKEGEEVSEQLFDRILGRVNAEDLYHPITNELILPANTLIGDKEAQLIASSGIAKVRIRSVLTCETERGVCSMCYGINMTNGKKVGLGEAVGVMAAQSIGEPGTQLTLRTFHIGGTASLIETESQQIAKGDGRIEYENIEYIGRDDGTYITLRRNGLIKLIDENNRIISRYSVPYGAIIFKGDGEIISTGDVIFTWDPYSAVILANNSGKVEFRDITEDITVIQSVDEATGQRKQVIIESKDRKINPHIVIFDDNGKSTGQYVLPIGALLMIQDGQQVKAGDALVKIPRESSKTKDITGGLPRVAELFESRKPKEPAIVSEIDGIVRLGELKRGVREVIVTPTLDGKILSDDPTEIKKYNIPIGRHILVHDGEDINAGERLIEGSVLPQDILAILGPRKVQEYLVNEIQDVYRIQGVKINDKHIEVIVRQMMQKVRIIDPGDTMHLEGDLVDYTKLLKYNRRMSKKVIVIDPGNTKFDPGQLIDKNALNRELRRIRKLKADQIDDEDETEVVPEKEIDSRPAKPAVYEQILLGITQASLATESFISAASFQETTRVLTEAAISRKTDTLRGLKENVIMGHLIPAGTGTMKYRSIIVEQPEDEETLKISTQAEDVDEQIETINKTISEKISAAVSKGMESIVVN
ncbi:MAG: DNA-directed RNA polymerase subunit beta' [Candidatus Hatepunaea meridiana]|nr:DNA-directed RNA polymerase subunit beta' [Candidatus Hatepunaea meridiana]